MSHLGQHSSVQDVDQLVQQLRISKHELARALGLWPESITHDEQLRSTCTQQRLQQTMTTLTYVQPWAGSTRAAWSWYRSQPIPSFGGITASQLVSSDRGEQVLAYLAAVAEGGHA